MSSLCLARKLKSSLQTRAGMCLECVQLVFSFCLDLKNENSKAPLGPCPALAGLGCALACGGYREFVFRGSLVCGCFVSGSETENRAPQSLHMDLRVCTSTGANRSGICPAIFLGDLNSTHSFLMLEGLLLGLLGGRIIAFVKLADLTQELLSPAPSHHMVPHTTSVVPRYPSIRHL